MNIQARKKAIVVFSGGQDSTTCLYWALAEGFEVKAVTFAYGQRHFREIEAAHLIAQRAGVEHEIVELGHGVLHGTSPLVSDNTLEQYADENSLPGGLEKTFVPMRNQLFLTIAANRAYAWGAHNLVTGVCQEDFGGYPDCRDKFIMSLEETCNLGTFTNEPNTMPKLVIHTPLMYLTKAQSIAFAEGLDGCYAALAYSHTSYDGQYPPTGHDHATLLRSKGFIEAMVPDPLVLRAVKEGLMDMPTTPNYNPTLVDAYGAFLN